MAMAMDTGNSELRRGFFQWGSLPSPTGPRVSRLERSASRNAGIGEVQAAEMCEAVQNGAGFWSLMDMYRQMDFFDRYE